MARRIVTLTRTRFTPYGVFGEIDTGSFRCVSMERPKEGDHPCIAVPDNEDHGVDVDWTDWHPHHNPCFELMNVKGRTAILIHAANWFQQLLGCLAPGTRVEDVVDESGHALGAPGAKQLGISGSGPALKALLDDLHRQPFRLIIKEVA